MATRITRIPREEEVEAIFSKILQSPEACKRLSERFYEHLSEDNFVVDSDPEHFAKILFSAYENQDISALLLEICQRSMFDLLRESYLIPKRFHGKAGENPALLTDADGNLRTDFEKTVSHHDYAKFQEILKHHTCAPRSRLYLADGYDMVRSYTDDLDIEERFVNPKTRRFDTVCTPGYGSAWLDRSTGICHYMGCVPTDSKERSVRNGLLRTGDRNKK